MKITFDKEAGATYICLRDISKGEVTHTASLSNSINIDLNKKRKIVGVEIIF